MRNFSPVSEMRKGRRRVVARNSRNKATTVKHKIITFTPIIALATLIAVSLQLNEMLMMWKIQQAMQDDAKFIRRIHPAFIPNRAEVFMWQNFQPAYQDPGWKNRDIGHRASPPSHMNTSKMLTKDSEVRRARSRRPGQPGQPGSYEEAQCPFCPENFRRNLIVKANVDSFNFGAQPVCFVFYSCKIDNQKKTR